MLPSAFHASLREPRAGATGPATSGATNSRLQELESALHRQALLIETLSRLLLTKGVVSETELNEWLSYVDGLDGSVDGRLAADKSPVECPKCRRKSPPTASRCIYCSQEMTGSFLATPRPSSSKEAL